MSGIQTRHVTLLVAGTATFAALCAIATLRSVSLFALYILLLAATLVLQTRNVGILWTMAKWLLPFVVPLLLIHGLLNTAHDVDYWFMNVLPIRPMGFVYGALVSLNILLLATVAGYWLNTNRDDMIDDLIRLNLPMWSILFISQGVAVGAIVERRVATVYLAQRARGICVGPGVLARIRAFPSVLIPAVIATLIEAESRVPALVSRGFGSANVVPLPRKARSALAQLPWVIGPLFWLVLTGTLQALL